MIRSSVRRRRSETPPTVTRNWNSSLAAYCLRGFARAAIAASLPPRGGALHSRTRSARPGVQLPDHPQRRQRVVHVAARLLALFDARQRVGPLGVPGAVFAGVLEDRRLRRPHLREHLVVVEPLDAVAAAEAVHVELGVAAVDLEAERVLPLGAAGVEPGDLAAGRLEQGEAVVLDLPLPEEASDVARDVAEVAE